MRKKQFSLTVIERIIARNVKKIRPMEDLPLRPDLNGALLKQVGTDGIYQVDQGVRRAFTKLATFFAIIRDNAHVDAVADIERVPFGGNYPDDILFLKASGRPEIYLLDGGKKRWISGPEVFELYQYRRNIQSVSPGIVDSIPDGPPVVGRK